MKHCATTTICAALLAGAAVAADPKTASIDMNAWRGRLPEEVKQKLPNDMSFLLEDLGYDARPEDQAKAPRHAVKVWGNDFCNFDEDETNDWIVQIHTTDFRGRAVCGTLIYDRTEHGWTCIAKLPGTFPCGWGKPFEGRRGIRTLERVPDDSPRTEQERYYRWDGRRYIADRVEYARGG